MKLKSILKTLTREYLEGIQSHWGISPADLSKVPDDDEARNVLVANLYQRLQNRLLWERATKDLTDVERGLVNFLAINGGDLDAEEVTRRYFEGNVREMAQVVKSLGHRGIVFFDDVPGLSSPLLLVGIPEPFLRYIELPSYWEGYLGNFLKELSTNELKHIATQGLRLEPENNCKNYLIWLIRKSLVDPKFLRRYIDRMPEGPRELFQLLEQSKGVCVYRDLLELNVQRHYDHQRVDALHWLLNTSGLVFTAVPGANKYSSLLMIPRDVLYIINSNFQTDVRTFRQLDSISVVSKESSPALVLDNSNTVLRDLVTLCTYIDRHSVRALATGGIGKNDLKKAMPLLSRFKTLKYAEFLSLFAIQKKFLSSTGKEYRISQDFLEWLGDSQRAYTDLLQWWLSANEWNEEFIEGNTVHVEPPVTGLVNVVPLRRIVLEILKQMPKDRWLLFDAFAGEVVPKIAQDIPKRGEPLAYDKHTRSNELVVESVLAECLHWLGLVAIGVSSEEDTENIGMRRGDGKKLKARGAGRGRPRKQAELAFTFRFTDLGRFVLSHSVEEWPTMFQNAEGEDVVPMKYDTDKFIVQQTHEVIVPPDLDLRTYYHLTEIAEVRSIDVMSLLALTKESLRAGMDNGLDAGEILRYLERGSRTPIPQSLSLLVQECGEKHGQMNMGFAGGYIVVDDEVMLAAIRSNKKVAPYIKDVIDRRMVLLTPDADVRRVARELHKIGFMPRLAGEHVHVKDEDTYHLTLTREDMYTLIATIRFAMNVTDERGRAVAEERLAPLLERMRPSMRSYQALAELSEPLVKMWTRALQANQEAQVSEIKGRYTEKLTQMVTQSAARGPSRRSFSGPNPAEDPDSILSMIDFAIENEFQLEIEYIKSNRTQVKETLQPESIEADRLLARVPDRGDQFSVFKVDRILKSRLV